MPYITCPSHNQRTHDLWNPISAFLLLLRRSCALDVAHFFLLHHFLQLLRLLLLVFSSLRFYNRIHTTTTTTNGDRIVT